MDKEKVKEIGEDYCKDCEYYRRKGDDIKPTE
jgi:hypothetical protein